MGYQRRPATCARDRNRADGVREKAESSSQQRGLGWRQVHCSVSRACVVAVVEALGAAVPYRGPSRSDAVRHFGVSRNPGSRDAGYSSMQVDNWAETLYLSSIRDWR